MCTQEKSRKSICYFISHNTKNKQDKNWGHTKWGTINSESKPNTNKKTLGLFLLEWGLSIGLLLNVPPLAPHKSPLTVPENLVIWKAKRECFTGSTESERVLQPLEHFLWTPKSKAGYWGSPIYHQPVEIVSKKGNREEHLPKLFCASPTLYRFFYDLKCIPLPFFLSSYVSSILIQLTKVRMRKFPIILFHLLICRYQPDTEPLSTNWSLTCILHSSSCSAFEGSVGTDLVHYCPRK